MGLDFSKVYGSQPSQPKPDPNPQRPAGRSIYEVALRGPQEPAKAPDQPAKPAAKAPPKPAKAPAKPAAKAPAKPAAKAPAGSAPRARRPAAAAEAPAPRQPEAAAPPRKAAPRRAAADVDEDEDDSREEAAGPRRRSDRRRRRHDGAAAEAKRQLERLEEASHEEIPAHAHFGGEFRQFGISAPILKAVEEMGWKEPSEIQKLMIPKVLMGRDVVGQARTGTGKTGAFALPILERHTARGVRNEPGRAPEVLVLTPTRELALQIEGQFEQLGVHTGVRTVCVYGGAPLEPQLRALRAGSDVVVGTPGRVMDHVRRRTLRLDEISCFILDEADRMFDIGFRDDIYWIARRMPRDGRQTLLLSATLPEEVLRLAAEVTSEPEMIRTAPVEGELTVNTVEQFYVAVDPERKLDLLAHLIDMEEPEKGMVFCRTKRGADKVAERLRRRGIDAGEIHGDLKQKRREQILERFREGNLHVMVATDVAARGLDIQGVTHIFNFDVPENAEDYVHRVGRTARMGRRGRAFTFVTREDGDWLTNIEKLINKEIRAFPVEGFRTEATDEERLAQGGRATLAPHPMAEKFSPALLALLNQRRGRSGGPGGRGGPPRGGGGGGRGERGGRGGGGRGERGGRGGGGGRGERGRGRRG